MEILTSPAESRRPSLFTEKASEFSFDDLLQHFLVERQIRNGFLQSCILLLKHPGQLHLGRQQAHVLLAQIEMYRLNDPDFMINVFCVSERYGACFNSALPQVGKIVAEISNANREYLAEAQHFEFDSVLRSVPDVVVHHHRNRPRSG